MKEKIRRILQIIMGVTFGVFIGSSLWKWEDCRCYPDLYVVNSAPWYTSIIVSGIFTAAVILVLGIVWTVLGRDTK